jgi:NAD-dependent deacetylase
MDEGAATGLAEDAVRGGGLVVLLTGAGVSAASGIPTFRGPEGYWTVGSTVYRPEELATSAAFRRDPDEVWAWYLHRLGVCRAAQPNPAHAAAVRLEAALGDRFVLITQNVDGLHRRAGSSAARTYEVHGDIGLMRCAAACSVDLVPVPDDVAPLEPGEPLTEAHRTQLRCPGCGGPARPHVLWFDESYDEAHYRFASSLAAAGAASLLITAGTSGATNLPNLVVGEALRAGAALLDVNPDRGPFGDAAERAPRGGHVAAPAAEVLPRLAERIIAAA